MNSVLRIVLQRLALGVLTLLVVSILIFAAVNALPGDFAERAIVHERVGRVADALSNMGI